MFTENKEVQTIPYDSLICSIVATAQGGEVIISSAEQKKAAHLWQRIGKQIEKLRVFDTDDLQSCT